MLPGHWSATPPPPPPPPHQHAASLTPTRPSRQCTSGRARDNHLQPRLMDFCRCKHFGSYELEVGQHSRSFSPPTTTYTYFISFAFSEGAKNCRRIFVMVLKGLSASKPRELVVQPISETTQSFLRRRRERAPARVDKIPRLSSQFRVLT